MCDDRSVGKPAEQLRFQDIETFFSLSTVSIWPHVRCMGKNSCVTVGDVHAGEDEIKMCLQGKKDMKTL